MKNKMKRINITIDEKLYKKAHDQGLNLSGLIREKLDDYFNGNHITLSVSREMKQKYDEIYSILNLTDDELAPFLNKALNEFLKSKKKQIDSEINKLIKK